MTYSLSQKSLDHLEGVHPKLVEVIKAAIAITTVDFMVVEGLRSAEQMLVNYGKGRTADECLRKGVPAKYAQPSAAKVTWLANPLMSNHRKMPDGFGHAVDLGAWIDGKYNGNDVRAYDKIALAVLQSASSLHVHVRWGADWDQDGKAHEPGETDMGHFEIIL